jgi:hypothetical protein
MKHQLFTSVLFLLRLITVARAEQDEVFNAIFSQEYSISNLKAPTGYNVSFPSGMCSGRTWNYTHSFETDTGKGTFRVPHSKIYVDGTPCGPLPPNATQAQLYLESYMLLVPASLLTSQSSAESVLAGALYRDLLDPNDRHGLARVLFYELIKNGNSVWLGYEGISDRVCGGRLIFPRTTFIMFSRVPSDAARDLDISEAFGNNSHVYFQKGNQFHLVVDEPFNRTPTNPNRVCPAVQSLQTKQNSSSPSNSSSSNSASCFPASALVTLQNGSSAPMSEVSTGLKINDIGGLASEVFMFTHRDGSRSLHPFLCFKTAENFTLTISSGHYIYTPDGLRPAQNLRVGSVLILGDGRQALVLEKFTVLREGLFNPQTISGSLIVDGFAVSAYTTAVAPSIAHAILCPLRLLYRSSWTKTFVQRKLSHLFDGGAREFSKLIRPLSGTEFVA